MKTRIFLVPLIISAVLLGYNFVYGQSMKELLNDSAKQKEAFDIILGNQELMSKFMETVGQNEESKTFMINGLMGMMKQDTAFGNNLNMNMMGNAMMMRMMMNGMVNKLADDSLQAKGMIGMMMHNNMMKSMMQNMMNMNQNGNMPGMKNKDDNNMNEEDHSKHHH